MGGPPYSAEAILAVLDAASVAFTFPAMDNGYVFPAATRMCLFRASPEWAITIEIFGYSPRAGIPDIHVAAFGSRLCDRKRVEEFVNESAHRAYLANNPHNESRFYYPIQEGDWIDGENQELVSGVGRLSLRGRPLVLPEIARYQSAGVSLTGPRPAIFELCRLLAAENREQVLATTDERRGNVPPEMQQILQLEEWNHPDGVGGELPSANETFRQIAEVLVGGDLSKYRPTRAPNTHWQNWPEGGLL